MLDISDGLAADAAHLAAASAVGIRIDADRLPLGPGVSTSRALSSGEEYELLVAAPPDVAQRLIEQWSAHSGVPLTDIGEVIHHVSGGRVQIVGRNADELVEFAPGYDHFTG